MLKRILSLACCLSLTVGLFTYRPPEAKAIVTEASLATSVLWSFMQSAGITFNGTGMNSSSWAEAIEPYLRDFTEWKDSAAKSFWHWLGYDGASEFIKALSWSKITHPTTMPFPSVVIPPAVAKKMGEFTHWFAEKIGLASGGNSQVVSYNPATNSIILPDGKSFYFSDTVFTNIAGEGIYLTGFSKGSGLSLFDFSDGKIYLTSTVCLCIEQNGEDIRLFLRFGNKSSYLTNFSHRLFDFTKPFYLGKGVNGGLCAVFETLPDSSYREKGYLYQGYELSFAKNEILFDDLFTVSKTQESRVTAVQPGALSPTYDDKGEKPTVVAYPNIDGDLSSINDLLQQILDKLAANDLNSSASLEGEAAPDVPATDIGWKGTIEKIYQGIIDLPGRIADAFKTLLEGLFAPDAALMQEMTDTFKGKFSFLTTLHKVGTDLFGMTAETDPPVIWVHLEDAEGKYTYGGPVKALDLSWYQRYKADVDKLISGFLWLAFLWLLFKRAASIIHGGEMYTEYASDIRDYYRSGKKDDGPTVPINRRLGE